MKIKTQRNEEPKEVKYVWVYIEDRCYKLNEDILNQLTINKTSTNGNAESMRLFPSCSNEISIF